MNENHIDPISKLKRHVWRLYVLFGVLAVTFVLLAALVWWRSPHEILRNEIRNISLEMAQRPLSPEEAAEAKRIREQTLEDRIAGAKAIVLCEHTINRGKTKCKVTRILKHETGFNLPYSVGNPILEHERKIERNVSRGEGMITFLTDSFAYPSSALAIHHGLVTDSHVDPSRPPHDPYVRREFTVDQVVKMIETVNQASEANGTNAPQPQR